MAPSSYLLQRVSSARYLCTCSMLWSLTALLIPACHNWQGLMGLRFFMGKPYLLRCQVLSGASRLTCRLGCLEAIIVPSISLVIAGFYKKAEQPPRNAIAFAAASSIINGFLSWIVGHISPTAPLRIWQYLFLITGE
jgi:ACS family allantoate permease-like MFS transporter